MKGMSQRKFYKSRVNDSQTSSPDGATGGNGDGHPGAAPGPPGVPAALFRGSPETTLCLTISLMHSLPARL